MNPEAVNMAVASLIGEVWEKLPGNRYPHIWQRNGVTVMPHSRPPNYYGDLNAMHDAENTIHNKDFSNPEWMQYLHLLDMVINQRRAHATAAHRAEAFLRLHGKWVES